MFTNHEGVTVHPDALAPGTEVGNWRVVERLGVGGYGAVYRVEDMGRLGDFYALKVALYGGDERAEREVALLLTKGEHPNVVGFHGCARWPHPKDGLLVFVMDFVPGLPLHQWAETVLPRGDGGPDAIRHRASTAALAPGLQPPGTPGVE